MIDSVRNKEPHWVRGEWLHYLACATKRIDFFVSGWLLRVGCCFLVVGYWFLVSWEWRNNRPSFFVRKRWDKLCLVAALFVRYGFLVASCLIVVGRLLIWVMILGWLWSTTRSLHSSYYHVFFQHWGGGVSQASPSHLHVIPEHSLYQYWNHKK